MSEESDSISDVSNVSEDAVTNTVHQSQLDPGVSSCTKQIPVTEDETAKPSKQSSSQFVKYLLKSPSGNLSTKKQGEYRLNPNATFDVNTYDYNYINSQSSKPPVPKPPSANIMAQNIKKIREIPHPPIPPAIPKRVSSKSFDPDRFESYRLKSVEKRDKIKREVDEEVMGECSFKPRIHRSCEDRVRTYTEYYEDMIKFQERKADRIQELVMMKGEPEVHPYKPSLCNRSIHLAKSKNLSFNFQDRLYTTKFSHFTTNESKDSVQSISFAPKINKYDKPRHSSVSDSLYQDAIRRREKTVIEFQPTTIEASSNSVRILKKAFEKEFDESCTLIDCDARGKLNYKQFIELFKSLKYLSFYQKPTDEEFSEIFHVWGKLSDKQNYVHIKELREFMLTKMLFIEPNNMKEFVLIHNRNKRKASQSEKKDKSAHNRKHKSQDFDSSSNDKSCSHFMSKKPQNRNGKDKVQGKTGKESPKERLKKGNTSKEKLGKDRFQGELQQDEPDINPEESLKLSNKTLSEKLLTCKNDANSRTELKIQVTPTRGKQEPVIVVSEVVSDSNEDTSEIERLEVTTMLSPSRKLSFMSDYKPEEELNRSMIIDNPLTIRAYIVQPHKSII